VPVPLFPHSSEKAHELQMRRSRFCFLVVATECTSHIILLKDDKPVRILLFKKEGGDLMMDSVRIPEMLSPELAKALAGNVYVIKYGSSPKEEITASRKGFFKSDNKPGKKKEKECVPQKNMRDIDMCCQKKVKCIFVLNSAVVININSAREEDHRTA